MDFSKEIMKVANDLKVAKDYGFEKIEIGKTYTSKSGDKIKIVDISFQCGVEISLNNLTILVDYEYTLASNGKKGKSKGSAINIITMLRS